MAWLRRRHEAILDMQHLFARMRDCRDIGEALQIQRDWMGNALRRLADDAAGCQRAAEAILGAATGELREMTIHPNPVDMLRQPANDARTAATPRGPGLKAAGER